MEVKFYRIYIMVTKQKTLKQKDSWISALVMTGKNSLNGEIAASGTKKHGILIFLDEFLMDFVNY